MGEVRVLSFAHRYGIGLVVCDRCGGAVDARSGLKGWAVVWPAQVTSFVSEESVPRWQVCPGCLSEDERVQLEQSLQRDRERRTQRVLEAFRYGDEETPSA